MEETKEYMLADDGESLLLGFLDSEFILHGMDMSEMMMDNEEILIESYLGYGAYSNVWLAKYFGEEVIKSVFFCLEYSFCL